MTTETICAQNEYADLGFLRNTECTFDGGAESRDGNLGRYELHYLERLDRRLKEFHTGRTFRGFGSLRERDGSPAAASLQMGVWG